MMMMDPLNPMPTAASPSSRPGWARACLGFHDGQPKGTMETSERSPHGEPPSKFAKTWNGSWNYMELLHSKLRFSQNAHECTIGIHRMDLVSIHSSCFGRIRWVNAPYPTKTSTLSNVSAKHTDEAFEMLKQSGVSKHQTGSWAAGPSEKKGYCMTLLYWYASFTRISYCSNPNGSQTTDR